MTELIGCPSRKIPYVTRAEALAVARTHHPKQRGSGAKAYAYQCERCSHWHLSSMSRSMFKRLRRQRRKQAEGHPPS